MAILYDRVGQQNAANNPSGISTAMIIIIYIGIQIFEFFVFGEIIAHINLQIREFYLLYFLR